MVLCTLKDTTRFKILTPRVEDFGLDFDRVLVREHCKEGPYVQGEMVYLATPCEIHTPLKKILERSSSEGVSVSYRIAYLNCPFEFPIPSGRCDLHISERMLGFQLELSQFSFKMCSPFVEDLFKYGLQRIYMDFIWSGRFHIC